MVKKRCAWGTCKSDNRYMDRDYMKGVTFAPFPKPKTQREKCERWIRACGRPDDELNVGMIGRHHFVCSKHFADSGGPNRHDPDPLPADPSMVHRRAHKRRTKPKPLSRQCSKVSKKLAAEALIMLHDPYPSLNTESCDSHDFKKGKTEEPVREQDQRGVNAEWLNSLEEVSPEPDIDMVKDSLHLIARLGHPGRLHSPSLNIKDYHDVTKSPRKRAGSSLASSPVDVRSVNVLKPLGYVTMTAGESPVEETPGWSETGVTSTDDACGSPKDEVTEEVTLSVDADSPLFRTLAVLASQLSSQLDPDQLSYRLPSSADCSVRCTNCDSFINPTLTEIIKILSVVSTLRGTQL